MSSDLSYVQPYDAPRGAERFTGIRLGEDNSDIMVFYDGNATEISEYLQGFMFLGYFAIFVFSVWSVFLLVCMCCGRRRVGFLSGRAFEQRQTIVGVEKESTDRPDESSSSASWDAARRGDDDEQQSSPAPLAFQDKQSRRHGWALVEPLLSLPNIVRCIFLVVSVLVMILAILFMAQGLQGLQGSVDTYHDNAQQVQRITADGRNLMDQGSRAVEETANLIRAALERESDPNVFCPADPSLGNSAAALDAFRQIEQALDAIDYLQDFENTDVQDLNDGLDEFQDNVDDIEQELDQVNFFNAAAKIVLVFYILIPLCMMAATVLAMFGKQICFLTQLIQFVWWPIFIVLTLWFVLLAMGLPILGGINSDFCLPRGQGSSPDDLIFEVLQREGYGPGNDRYDAAEYFIRYQCQAGDNPFDPLIYYLGELDDSQISLEALIGAVRDDTVVSSYCNRNFNTLVGELEELDQLINLLRTTANDFMDTVSCPNIVPIYTSTVYDASCSNSTKAVFWMYMTAFLLAFFGFVMVTLRASYRVSREAMDENEKENDNVSPVMAGPQTPPSVIGHPIQQKPQQQEHVVQTQHSPYVIQEVPPPYQDVIPLPVMNAEAHAVYSPLAQRPSKAVAQPRDDDGYDC